MTQTGLLAGQLGLQAALERVEHTEWLQRARSVMLRFVYEDVPFSADDLRRVAGDPPGSANALGALFREYAEAGRIVVAGVTHSTRPGARGRRITLWKGPA